MNTVDVGDGICIGNYEAYAKVKSYFQKFIHVIDYPNFKKIEEEPGHFLILNGDLAVGTIRELDKFSYHPVIEEAETIYIDTEDLNSGAAVAAICKITRNSDVFGSIAEVMERVYKAYGQLPVFDPKQMEPALKYFRRLILEKQYACKKQYTVT